MSRRNKIRMPFSQAPTRRDNEPAVHGNLVVTPSDMLRMAQAGRPVSAQNMSFQPEQGEKNPSWDLPLDRLRGVDPATMWEEQQVIRARAKRAHDADRKRFGDNFETKQ